MTAPKCLNSKSGGQRTRRRAQPSRSISAAAVFSWSPVRRMTDLPSRSSNDPPKPVFLAQSSRLTTASRIQIERPAAPVSTNEARERDLSGMLVESDQFAKGGGQRYVA